MRGLQSTHLGTLGGALVGREGTCGGAPNHSLLLLLGKGGSGPGLKGTGGAPECGPGEGMAGAGPRPDTGRVRGALSVGRLWVVGLGGGDLRTDESSFSPSSPSKKYFMTSGLLCKNYTFDGVTRGRVRNVGRSERGGRLAGSVRVARGSRAPGVGVSPTVGVEVTYMNFF